MKFKSISDAEGMVSCLEGMIKRHVADFKRSAQINFSVALGAVTVGLLNYRDHKEAAIYAGVAAACFLTSAVNNYLAAKRIGLQSYYHIDEESD